MAWVLNAQTYGSESRPFAVRPSNQSVAVVTRMSCFASEKRLLYAKACLAFADCLPDSEFPGDVCADLRVLSNAPCFKNEIPEQKHERGS